MEAREAKPATQLLEVMSENMSLSKVGDEITDNNFNGGVMFVTGYV